MSGAHGRGRQAQGVPSEPPPEPPPEPPSEPHRKRPHLLAFASYPVLPWRNGQGITRNVAEGDGWQLRLADIGRSGRFSHFAGCLRLFAIVDGAVVLHLPSGESIACDSDAPAAGFDGGAPPDCELVGRPARALNLIMQAGMASGRLERRTLGERFEPVGCGHEADAADQVDQVDEPGETDAADEAKEMGRTIAVFVQSGRIECRVRGEADGERLRRAGTLDTLVTVAGTGLLLRACAGDDGDIADKAPGEASAAVKDGARAVVLVARIWRHAGAGAPPTPDPGTGAAEPVRNLRV